MEGDSGERASNAWAICLQAWDNLPKGGLIPNVVFVRMDRGLKVGTLRGLPLREEPAAHQLVGEVTAHQG